MINKAREFAIRAHGDQKYGTFPYEAHLQDVVAVLIRFGFTSEDLLSAAWLHDVVEDTKVSLPDIVDAFGQRIADLVGAVTSEPGKNRKERNQKTYSKIVAVKDAVVLKMADRIANLEASKTGSPSLFEMYEREHNEFMDGIRPALGMGHFRMVSHMYGLIFDSE